MPPPARLAAFQTELQHFNLDTQAPTSYSITLWQRHLGNEDGLTGLHDRFQGEIARKDLSELSAEVIENAGPLPLRSLFLATMLWGFGDIGYGPWRTCQMFADHRFQDLVSHSVQLIREGQLVQAYQRFRLNECGPSFFTKFFYVVGLGLNTDLLPLVFDDRVRSSLARLADHAEFDADEFPQTRQGYGNYVNRVNEWAGHLHCRSDAIEFVLFDPAQLFWLWQG